MRLGRGEFADPGEATVRRRLGRVERGVDACSHRQRDYEHRHGDHQDAKQGEHRSRAAGGVQQSTDQRSEERAQRFHGAARRVAGDELGGAFGEGGQDGVVHRAGQSDP